MLIEDWFGYPAFFIDGHKILGVLYNNLLNQDCVLTEKAVARLHVEEQGVKVVTQYGSCYYGDIVVGADGVHSVTRDEIWRIGNEQSPGYFSIPKSVNLPIVFEQTTGVPICTRCIFGVSTQPDALEFPSLNVTYHKGRCFYSVTGPEGRTYWTFFDGWKLIMTATLPLLRIDPFWYFPMQTCVKAPRLDGLPMPTRPRSIPFTDELAEEASDIRVVSAVWAFATGSAGLLLVAARSWKQSCKLARSDEVPCFKEQRTACLLCKS